MKKQALIVGGGSKFGFNLSKHLLETGWIVNVISGSSIPDQQHLNHIQINWSTLAVADLQKYLQSLPEQNFIFFNQNSSALNKDSCKIENYKTVDLWKQEKHWSHSYFISCILPFHIIHTLGNRCTRLTKISWMLSSLIVWHDPNQIHFSDYIGNKFQNYILMKNFSKCHDSCFFGINPDLLDKSNTLENLDNLISFIVEAEPHKLNGNVYKFTTEQDLTFDKFKI